jgi:hypothetical protein
MSRRLFPLAVHRPEDMLVEAKVAVRRRALRRGGATIEAMERHPGTAAERAVVAIKPGINLSEGRYDLPPYQQSDQRN